MFKCYLEIGGVKEIYVQSYLSIREMFDITVQKTVYLW